LKSPKKIREKILPQIEKLRYQKLRPIVLAIHEDDAFDALTHLKAYVNEWNALLKVIEQIEG
jgi:hypothetical protein